MQITPRGFRFSGLIAVLGLLVLLLGFVIMLALPEIRYAAWGILALGILLLAAAVIIDIRQVSRALTGRRGRFGTGTTVMASIFIGITLVVNAISIGNYHRFDLIGVEQFILTAQTKEVLSQLETPVKALGFFTPTDPTGYGINAYATSLLARYRDHTDKLSIEIIDPDEHPDQARQYGITQYQTVVFQSGEHYRLVSPEEILEGAEHAFTSAILEVTGTVQKKLYFLTRHGEANINSATSRGYSGVKDGLLDNLYKVDTLDLIFTPSIPEDCTALIIAGPQQQLTSGEIEILERYLEDGGWLMILINPDPPPEIRQLLSSWGIDIEDGIVIDPSSYVDPNKDIPLIAWQRNIWALQQAFLPGATAIIPQEGLPETIVQLPLIWTSTDSWLERNFDPTKEPEFNEGIERDGSLALAVLITMAVSEAEGEATEEEQALRLVVFGDSDFCSNQHFYNGNNGELFLNSVNLLTAGTELISIERKVLPFRRLVVGPEVSRFISYSSIGLLPVLVLLAAGIIWWRRR